MSNAKKSTTREKAAAARAAAEASERRRDRAVKFGIGAGVVVVVGGIIGATLIATQDSGETTAEAPTNPNAALPAGVVSPEYGVPVGTAETPVLDVYEDFQCPACAALAGAIAPTMKELVDTGEVKVNYHPMNFLDRSLGNDASTRAASAFGCAADAGFALNYHTIVYANQPESEGTGYTQEALKGFGPEAGITGEALTTFETCVDDLTYIDWVDLSNEAAGLRGVTGTPTLFLNGEEVDRSQLASPEDLKAQILAAGGQ